MKTRSLGAVASAAAGITCSGGTNATPIVATIAPSVAHGLKIGERLSISGVTGLTAMNGQWTLSAVAATTATLGGTIGNGVFGGTAAVSCVMDTTPFMSGYTVACAINDASGIGAQAVFVGTILVKSSADDSTFADAKNGLALGANPGQMMIEVLLGRYMNFTCSAYTSGAASAVLMNW